MTDTLSQLIANEVARQVAQQHPGVPYGVWIAGEGWLKNEQGRVFADLHVEVARSAAHLWGKGAQVLPLDLPDGSGTSALQALEEKILAHQRRVRERTWRTRFHRCMAKFFDRTWRISTH